MTRTARSKYEKPDDTSNTAFDALAHTQVDPLKPFHGGPCPCHSAAGGGNAAMAAMADSATDLHPALKSIYIGHCEQSGCLPADHRCHDMKPLQRISLITGQGFLARCVKSLSTSTRPHGLQRARRLWSATVRDIDRSIHQPESVQRSLYPDLDITSLRRVLPT